MSTHLGLSIEEFEQNFTAAEALAAGLFVAEWLIGDELLRCYGTTEQEARDRLEYDLSQHITVRTPAASATVQLALL